MSSTGSDLDSTHSLIHATAYLQGIAGKVRVFGKRLAANLPVLFFAPLVLLAAAQLSSIAITTAVVAALVRLSPPFHTSTPTAHTVSRGTQILPPYLDRPIDHFSLPIPSFKPHNPKFTHRWSRPSAFPSWR